MVYGCLSCGFNLMKFKTLEYPTKYKHCLLFPIDSLRIFSRLRLSCLLCMEAKMDSHIGLICMEIASLGLVLLSLLGNINSWRFRPIPNGLIFSPLLCIMLNEQSFLSCQIIHYLYLYFSLCKKWFLWMVNNNHYE